MAQMRTVPSSEGVASGLGHCEERVEHEGLEIAGVGHSIRTFGWGGLNTECKSRGQNG